jgi:ribosomal protein L19E
LTTISEHLFETFLGTIAHNVNVCFPLIKIQPKHGTNIKKNNWFNEKLRKMRDTLQLLNTLRNNKTVDNTTYQNFRNLYRKELTKAKKKHLTSSLYTKQRTSQKQCGKLSINKNKKKLNPNPDNSDNICATDFNLYFTGIATY